MLCYLKLLLSVEKYYVVLGIARSLAAPSCNLAFQRIRNILAGLQPWGTESSLQGAHHTGGFGSPSSANRAGIMLLPRSALLAGPGPSVEEH